MVPFEPRDRFVDAGIADNAAAVDEDDPIGVRQRADRPLFGNEDRRAGPREAAHELEKLVGTVRIELRRRLIEQEHLGLERDRRREADPLELAAGQLLDASRCEVRDSERVEGACDTARDLGGGDAAVLEAERDLALDVLADDLLVGILEHERRRARELGRTRDARVEAAHDDASRERPAVEMRDERPERAQEGRLPRTGRAENEHDLAWLDLESDGVQRRPRRVRVRKREAIDARYSHSTPIATTAAAATIASRSTRLHGERGGGVG